MNQQDELDWHRSAIKYYQSFRILSFFGYTKQAISLLCLSIEKFLKIYIALKYNSTIKKSHDLKKLFIISKLDKNYFPIVHKICDIFVYNKLRYEFEATTNQIGLVHKDLDKEIKQLYNLVVDCFNKKYNTSLRYYSLDMQRQDRKYKKYCLRRALTSYDKTLRIEFT